MAETDAELVQLALDGDQAAFAELIQRYQKLVFNIVYHYLGRSGEVEDLAQDVFLKLYRSLNSYDPSRPMKHWVGKIASNSCLDEIRKRKVRKTMRFGDLGEEEARRVKRAYESSKDETQLSAEEARDCWKLLEAAMDVLNEKDRMAFVLREIEGMPYSDLAELLESSEVAARIRVSRARKALQEALKEFLNG